MISLWLTPMAVGSAPKPADKPGSVVGDHLSGTTVTRRLWRPTRGSAGTGRPAPAEADFAPAWPCSRWGMPGRPCHHERRWSLTPPFHHHRGSLGHPGCLLFCGPFPSGNASVDAPPPGRYPAPCPVEPGLSSPPAPLFPPSGGMQGGGGATAWPTWAPIL